MPDGLAIALALALGAGVTACLVPVMIRLAHATGFLDRPAGYKGHSRPTPYLGGSALIVGFAVAAVVVGREAPAFGVILGGALVLWVLGTVDDRVGVGPGIRVLAEIAAAMALWSAGVGWHVVGIDGIDLLISVVWVVGIVNACNLMDNMDGAAGAVGAAVAAGIAVLALDAGQPALAALVLACGAGCLGFLPYNLARPSRIFLGDGGSMPLGFVLAAGAMAAVHAASGSGWIGLAAAIPLLGLPILDTALVVVSRVRRGVQVLSGGRDHLTFRLRDRLGSSQRVALALGATQSALCALGVVIAEADVGPAAGLAALYLVAGTTAIAVLEAPWQPATRAVVAVSDDPSV